MTKQYAFNKFGALVPLKPKKEWSAESKKAKRQRRRAPIGAGGFSGKQLRELGNACGWHCRWCGAYCKDDYHVDHITPLSRGGSNRIENICIACPKCNLSKGAQTGGEWGDR